MKVEVEIRLAVMGFGDGSYEGPCHAQVHRQVLGHPPIVLDIGTEQFPAAPGGGAIKSLIVDVRRPIMSQKEIRGGVAGRTRQT